MPTSAKLVSKGYREYYVDEEHAEGQGTLDR